MESKKQLSNWKIQKIKKETEVMSALKSSGGGGNTPIVLIGSACGTATTTSTQPAFTITTSTKHTSQQTLEKYGVKTSQDTMSCVQGFLAKHSALLEKGKGLKTLVARCFLRLRESLRLKNLRIYSLRMSRGYSITRKGRLSESSFKRWMNWGMTCSGWCLTASFSESPRTGSVCSLSEILEENPDQKYYLSEKMQERFKNYIMKRMTVSQKLDKQGGFTE